MIGVFGTDVISASPDSAKSLSLDAHRKNVEKNIEGEHKADCGKRAALNHTPANAEEPLIAAANIAECEDAVVDARYDVDEPLGEPSGIEHQDKPAVEDGGERGDEVREE